MLVLRQHPMRCARTQTHSHQAKFARTVARNRVDESKRFFSSSVPHDLGRHASCPGCVFGNSPFSTSVLRSSRTAPVYLRRVPVARLNIANQIPEDRGQVLHAEGLWM